MSEMSQAQGPVCAHVDVDPTDDMVPPGAQSLRDPTLGTLAPGCWCRGSRPSGLSGRDVVGPDSNESSA